MWPSSPGTQGAAGAASGGIGGGGYQSQSPYSQGKNQSSRFNSPQNAVAVDAEHVVHLSLSEGMDANWPFGNSILESIYKVYKQKELLEDSVIIYRVQRAPERRVFYIDTGSLPTHKAMAFVERVKNEIHQRRIPNRTGGGNSIMDAAYNPLAIMEDYFFAQSAEGRGSKVETLPGGENLGEIDDLKYFNNKMMRGLRVPSSYLPTGPEDGTATYNDGRVGTAYIQEFRFSKYCRRMQTLIEGELDREFKIFLKSRGIQIDSGLFDLQFHEPQNFAKFRQIEVDAAQIGVFQPLSDVPYFSKRFLMERFLNLTKDEILENERMWREENADAVKNKTGGATGGEAMGGGGGLGDVGIRGGGGEDLDFGDEGDLEGGEEMGGDFSPLGGPGEEGGGEEPEET
jgi:hypothetical protein